MTTTTFPPALERLQQRWAAGHASTISCGPGWHDLLDRCDRDLAALCPDYRISRIRVKDGRLRYEIHLNGLPRVEPDRGRLVLAIRDTIDRYEAESGHICEHTGEAGQLMRRDGQLRTLADTFCADGWQPAAD
jgi:hypothetical protein